MAALFSAAGMADLATTGPNSADTPAMRAALLNRGYQTMGTGTIAGGASSGSMSDAVARQYFRRQADEDTTQVQKKFEMMKKRKLPGLNEKGVPEQITPNDLVQESFRDIRNPKSFF